VRRFTHPRKIRIVRFSLENLKNRRKEKITAEVTIAFSNSIQNDWFDIKMTVVSDDFEFNFD
jgi:non-specific serine/threonine protein kinase